MSHLNFHAKNKTSSLGLVLSFCLQFKVREMQKKDSNVKMRLFKKIFKPCEQLVMPSCQSRAERQKGRLNADKSALET